MDSPSVLIQRHMEQYTNNKITLRQCLKLPLPIRKEYSIMWNTTEVLNAESGTTIVRFRVRLRYVRDPH